MPAVKILRNLHDGFDEKGDPIFYKEGSIYEVDASFVKKWEGKKNPAISTTETIIPPSKKDKDAPKGDKK
ncbi:MAG TPA: hypothetical protein V6C96_02090 [Vampirovibrionales bacterium]